ncbi:GyrI-like domain-containing protein [Nakamurella deserti]|uniref:GyrI-like domain-containing protein n=1 Tax=Nakamurella deserti TaxID=2164074 RepID=UPI000DBE57AA|nr:GyrI-like domain-containing protein [Nakamurella deserti]
MKTDFKKTIDAYSARAGRFDTVRVPPLDYLMVDGHGDPNTAPAYGAAMASLYPLAYALKFLGKAELGRDHVVMPLEALWWSDDMDAFTSARDTSRWSWTVMIMVPDWITPEHLTAAAVRKDIDPAAVRLERLDEGLCVQTLHVGPYDAEGPVLATMHDEVIPGRGLRMTGRHHEIYLSDARRTAPAKLRTILRQPVAEVAAAG